MDLWNSYFELTGAQLTCAVQSCAAFLSTVGKDKRKVKGSEASENGSLECALSGGTGSSGPTSFVLDPFELLTYEEVVQVPLFHYKYSFCIFHISFFMITIKVSFL